MLFITLASSTMQTFAMVILIPSLCRNHHEVMTSLEIGLLISAATAGDLVAYRYSEPCISKFGIKWSLQLGFLMQIATSYAFWQVSFVQNDSDFATLAFLSRFGHGLGGGLLRQVCLIAHASSEKYRDFNPEDHFRWILQGESLGYLAGPLLICIMISTEEKASREIFLMLSVVTTIIWLFFTLCFSDEAVKARPGSKERTDERNQEVDEDLNRTAIQTNVNKLSK